MTRDHETNNVNETIADLREKLAAQDHEIAQLRKDLVKAQAQIPWLSEACGDDLWEL